MVYQPQLCLQQWQTPSLLLGLRLLTHPCCQQYLCRCPDFPDTAAPLPCALWAEDVDIPVDIASQAVLYVHAKFASELSQHPSADITCLSKPLQDLMVTAVRAITGDASFHLLCDSDAQSDGPAAGTATDNTAADNPLQQQQRLRQPPGEQANSINQPQSTGKCPLQPLGGLNEPPQTPFSTDSVTQCQWPPREAEAGGNVCSPASCAMACHCSARDTPCYPGRGCPMV